MSDKVRDTDLLNLNISLDDRQGQSSLIKFLTDAEKEELIKIIEEKGTETKRKGTKENSTTKIKGTTRTRKERKRLNQA